MQLPVEAHDGQVEPSLTVGGELVTGEILKVTLDDAASGDPKQTVLRAAVDGTVIASASFPNVELAD